MADWNPEDGAKLKHVGSVVQQTRTALADTLKFVDSDGKTVSFFKTAGGSGSAAFAFDFPEELALQQTGTVLVKNFLFSQATYPNAINPNLDGKPVLVLEVKGDKETNPTVKYTFVDMSKLISGKLDKVPDAVAGNFALFGESGALADSGIWLEDTTLKFLRDGVQYECEFSPAPIPNRFITDDTLYLDGNEFTFTGLADLSFHGGNFYAADDTVYATPLGSVDGDYNFRLTSESALNIGTASAITVAINQTGGASIDYSLDIYDLVAQPKWTEGNNNNYNYKPLETTAYVEANSGAENSFTYKQVTDSDATKIRNIALKLGATGLVTNGSFQDGAVTIREERDADGHLTHITAILGVSALPTDLTDFEPLTLTLIIKQSAKPYPHLQKTDVVLSDEVPDSYKAAGVSMAFSKSAATAGTYDFAAAGTTAGFVETVNGGNSIIDYSQATGGDTFTISGFSTGLTLVYNSALSGYYLMNGAVSVGTLVDDSLTITSMSAFALTDAIKNGTGTYTVTLKDEDSDHDHVRYNLYLADSFTNSLNAANGAVSATFATQTGGLSNTYVYTPATIGWHFKQTQDTTPAAYQTWDEYEYVATHVDETFKAFSLSGLREGLGELSIDISGNVGSIKSGNTVIAVLDKNFNTLTLNKNALPAAPSAAFDIVLGGAGASVYRLTWDNSAGRLLNVHPGYESLVSGAVSGTYDYSNGDVNTSGFDQISNCEYFYHAPDMRGYSFSLTGLRDNLGNLKTASHRTIVTTSGEIVGKFEGTKITLYENALPPVTVTTPDGKIITLKSGAFYPDYDATVTGADADKITLVLPQ